MHLLILSPSLLPPSLFVLSTGGGSSWLSFGQFALPVLLPLLFPYLGDTVAHLLKQRHFPPLVNDLIAWIVLLGAAISEACVEGLLTGSPNAVIPAVDGLATLLLTGPLTSLSPWLSGMSWVQRVLFNLFPSQPLPTPDVPNPPLATPQALTFQLGKVGTPLRGEGPKGQDPDLFMPTGAQALDRQDTTPLPVAEPPKSEGGQPRRRQGTLPSPPSKPDTGG